MLGLVVMEGLTLSGHPSIINKISRAGPIKKRGFGMYCQPISIPIILTLTYVRTYLGLQVGTSYMKYHVECVEII